MGLYNHSSSCCCNNLFCDGFPADLNEQISEMPLNNSPYKSYQLHIECSFYECNTCMKLFWCILFYFKIFPVLCLIQPITRFAPFIVRAEMLTLLYCGVKKMMLKNKPNTWHIISVFWSLVSFIVRSISTWALTQFWSFCHCMPPRWVCKQAIMMCLKCSF